MNLIAHLPDESRVWMFGAQRRITAAEKETLALQLQKFVDAWQAHGVDLAAGFEIVCDAIVVVSVDESIEPPSGCSIDKVFHLLKMQNDNFNLDFFQRTLLWTGTNQDICIFDINTALSAYRKGEINDQTPVVNMLPSSLGDLRSKFWMPLSGSWIAKKIAREL